jgi:predicted nucleic acid-binding protein
MNAVDTNVLIYRLDPRDQVKQGKARSLLHHLRQGPSETVLLWQVAGEFLRQLRSWQEQGQITRAQLLRHFRFIRRLFLLVLPTPQVLDRALDLADRYSLSHWDSMLLGPCIEAGVDTLYTENMGAPTRYDGVQLLNPFV